MPEHGAGPTVEDAAAAARAFAHADEPAARRELVLTYLRASLASAAQIPVAEVTADTSMTDLGLDSLAAIELLETVHDDVGGDLTIDELLGDATVATLADAIAGQRDTGAAKPVPRPEPGAPVPLSYAQQRLWFMHQVNPESAGYTIAAAFRIRGALRTGDLAAALRLTAADHEALRTVVRANNGVPEQVVLPDAELPLETIENGPELAARLGDWARRPFDLERAPLVRAALVTLSGTEHVLAIAGHHVVFDAASLKILLTTAGAHYAALGGAGAAPAPDALQHPDFARWQRTDPHHARREEADLAYWRERLRGVPPLGLPSDRPRPDRPTGRGAGAPFTVPPELAAAVTRLARAHDATPFMVLLATWKLLLSRHSGQPDVTVGVPVSNRDTPGFANTIGCFVDTLVLRTGVHGEPSFTEFLGRVRESTLAAYAHPVAPFDRLVDGLGVERHAGRNPLFEASFSLFPAIEAADALPGAEIEVDEIETGYVQFDLVLEMLWQGDGLRGRIRYTSDLYDPATIERLAAQFTRLLTLVTEDPGGRVSRYPLLDPADWARMLRRQPPGDPFGPVTAPLQAPFEAHSAAYPDDIALVDEHGSHTYGEVDARANRLAHLLRARGAGPEVRVGLAMTAQADLIVAVLGILKSGGAYVPVEPGDPAERIRDLFTDAGSRIVLTDSDAVRAALGDGFEVLRLDPAELQRQPETRPEPVGPHHLSYVIFTSGSTGRPKGVAVEHRHIVSFVRATEDYLGSRRGEVYAMVSSIAADLGLTTLLPALRTGGTVHVVPRDKAVDPMLLAERFVEIRLDHLKIAPSHLSALLLASGGAKILPSRTLVLGGEAVPWELVDRIRGYEPGVAIVNEYGPTETAVANIIHHAAEDGSDRGTPLMPMSVCLGGNRAYVLDEHLNPVPIGVPGELYLGGSQVVRGYLNRPGTTAEKFLPDPYTDVPGARMYATGDRVRWLDETTMEFYGRIDNQVKVRGFRVEPGEIESALRQHEKVRDAAVLAFREPSGDHVLGAFAVPAPESEVDEFELREYLRAKLPRHLVPAELTVLATMPVLAHGKVDRDALRALPRPGRGAGSAAAAPPADETRRVLLEIWCDLLGRPDVGVHDNFFDLGGHSLLLVQMQGRIEQRLGHRVAVIELMENHTVDALAGHLGTSAGSAEAADPAEDPAVARARARREARGRRRGASR